MCAIAKHLFLADLIHNFCSVTLISEEADLLIDYQAGIVSDGKFELHGSIGGHVKAIISMFLQVLMITLTNLFVYECA